MRAFGVPPVSSPLQNVERSRDMDIDQAGGDMDGGESRRESIASRVDNSASADASGDTRDRKKPSGEGRAGSVIEISDKDYRSFHLPCDALEDTCDSDQGA